MAPRRRSPINQGLPANTRCRDGLYSWRHPETKQEFGLGRNRQRAISEAVKANAHVYSKHPSLVERITGAATTWGEWCDTFEKLLEKRPGAEKTVSGRKSYLKRLRASFDKDRNAAKIDTKDCAEVIDKILDADLQRTAQKFKAFLVDCFDRMIAKGIRKDNPARVLDRISVEVNRARLQFDIFMKVYNKETLTWAKNAYALALVSGQDRESCVEAQVKDIHDGAWWNERGKTGARIVLPIDLRLDCFGMSLGDVVKQCRSTGVLSRHLIHHTQNVGTAKRGDPVFIDRLSKRFTATLATLQIDWGTKGAPTFHEIRSLSGRLYKAEGRVNPQELLGHKDSATTALYLDERGEWMRVGIK